MNVTDAQILKHTAVGEYMMHPAWIEVYQILTDGNRWRERVMGLPSGYRDWQVYLAMATAGFADDVIVGEDEDGRQTFVFPPVVIPIDEDGGAM